MSGCVALEKAPTGRGELIDSFVVLPDGLLVAVDGAGRAWRRSARGAWTSAEIGFVSGLALARTTEIWATHSSSHPHGGSQYNVVTRSLDGGRTYRAFDVLRQFRGELDAYAFIDTGAEPPLLLAKQSELFRVEEKDKELALSPFASPPPQVHFYAGKVAAGFYYLVGTRDSDHGGWARAVNEGDAPWIQLGLDVYLPFCTATSCWSAFRRILGTAAGQNDWQVPSGADAWFDRARQCLGLDASSRVIALGGATHGDDIAIVLAQATTPPRAVLVSTRFASIEFPFIADFQPVQIAFDASGNVLASRFGMFAYDGIAWRRLGP